MPELPDRPVEQPFFAATSEGADAVVRAARRRRRLQGAAAVSVVAVVVGAAVALQTPGSGLGSDRLSVAGDGPTPTATPSTRLTVPPGGLPASPATPGVSSRPLPTATGSAAGGTAPPPVVGPTLPPSARPSTPGRISPIHESFGTIASNDLCKDDASDADEGWCVRYLGPTSARRGHPADVSAEMCRLAAFPSASVSFSSTQEIQMDVEVGSASGTQVEWSAGEGEHYTSPGPTVSVGSGVCLIWTSTWDTRDEQGFLVPPGTYSVPFTIEAYSSAGVNTFWGGSGSIVVSD